MPAAGGLLCGDQAGEPSRSRRYDQDAGRGVRRGFQFGRFHRSTPGGHIMTDKPIRAPSLEALGMTKTFGHFTALGDVSLRVGAGEFHALLGENGAGKSTLVKCIMGFYSADKGRVLLDGQEGSIKTPRDARANGIGMVYQQFTLVPSLTGAENLVISRADAPNVIDWAKE